MLIRAGQKQDCPNGSRQHQFWHRRGTPPGKRRLHSDVNSKSAKTTPVSVPVPERRAAWPGLNMQSLSLRTGSSLTNNYHSAREITNRLHTECTVARLCNHGCMCTAVIVLGREHWLAMNGPAQQAIICFLASTSYLAQRPIFSLAAFQSLVANFNPHVLIHIDFP